MAYYLEEENENQENEAGNTIGPQGSSILGTSSAAAASGASSAPKADMSPDRASNFVGIKNYLDANKSQAGKLGDQASGVIDTSAGAARDAVTGLTNTFNQQADSAAIQNNEAALNKVGQAEALTSEEKEALKKQYNAQYGGPQNLTDLSDQYTDANKKLSTAKTNVTASDTEEGRQGIITQINNKPRNAGITNFDSVLLAAGGGREKLAQAADRNQDVTTDILGTANLSAQQKAADLKSQADAVRASTQGAVTGATNTFNEDLYKRVQDALNKTTNLNNAYTQDIADTALNADTLSAFGLNDQDSIYGLDLNNYLTQGDLTGINSANVANQNDYARYLALAEIAGIDPTTLTAENLSQAGTANIGPKIDTSGLKSALTGEQNNYNKKYTEEKGAIKSLLSPEVSESLGTYKDQILSATPREIESVWIPKIQQDLSAGKTPALYQNILKELNSSLAKWKNQQGLNRKITRAEG